MAADVRPRELREVDDLIAASSLGADGMAELCARTPDDRLAAIRRKTELSVADLLSRVCAGDTAAWEEIVRRYSRLVWARVRAFRLQDADASDAVQMTWLRLAENCHRMQFTERLPGWLTTTASRECLRILRQAEHVTVPVEVVADDLLDPSVGPEQRVIDSDVARELRSLVAELPPRGQALLRALFADNPQPYAKVARLTGIPLSSMGPARARALRQLRQMIEERGWTSP